ncbi:MAG: acetyltransferase [Mucilaginibacter sp.]
MIYLYGAGGHAKVILEILEAQQILDVAVIDENKSGMLLGIPIVANSVPLTLTSADLLILAIGNNFFRKSVSVKIDAQLNYITAIHPSSNISPSAVIGEGTVVMAGVSVNADTVVGRHCILNTNCSVDHDCKLNDFVHVSPNAALAGNVKIDEGAHVGIGACVIQGIKIGKWATIGAGAVVIDDVPDHAVVVGNPAKIIKYTSPDK